MDEVEEICDNVTIMRTGRVAYHGSIDELRAQAPDPSHRLATSDDDHVMRLSAEHPAVSVTAHHDGGLALRAQTADADNYLIALGRAGVAVRALHLEIAPPESLFFMLTETDSATGSAQAGLQPRSRNLTGATP